MHNGKLIARFARLLSVLVFAAYCHAGMAHHSPVAFDTDVTDFTLTGVITSVDIRNPHSTMTLHVVEDDGTETEWDIEFSSINLLVRRGWDFDRLKVGEQVTCTGNPSALGRQEMYMWSVALADGTEYGR